MNELRRRIAALAPEKRAVLLQRNPLSFAQRRFWFMVHLDSHASAAYNVPAGFRLAGPLDAALLRRSLEVMVERHAALRTTFPSFDGQPLQLVGPPGPVVLPIVDLGALPAERRETAAGAAARASSTQTFDLQDGPLFRALLIRLGPADHAFVLDLHHILCDGWSQEILQREIGEAYLALLQGRAPNLPPLPVQYLDYARWQVAALANGELEPQIELWRRRLAGETGLPPVLDLPGDRPRGKAPVPGGGHAVFLPPALVAALGSLGRSEGASPFMVGLALFQTLLYRHTRQEDFAVGAPLATRPRTELEGLVGLFQNMLALRADLSGRPTFREVLARVRDRTLEAYDNADIPFDLLVERLQPPREPGVHPLFQVTFTHVTRPPVQLGPAFDASGSGDAARVQGIELAVETGKYDLSVSMADTGGAVTVAVEWDAGLFDPPTGLRLLGHFLRLTESATADPSRPVDRLELLTASERWQVLGEWNNTAAVYPGGQPLRIIESWADRAPGNVAAVYEEESLTYGELERRVNQLAWYLIGLGVRPEDRVGTLFERSFDAIVAPLAAAKAGAAYVPLDPEHPADRLAHQIEDAGVRVVLTRSGIAVPETAGTRLVLLDAESEVVAACPAARPNLPVWDDSALYVLYTSGSTGRPKGAVNTHAGLRNRVLFIQDLLPLTPDDRVLQKTPFSFDVSVWELFWPLMVGARIVTARPGGHLDPPYLVDLIERAGVTLIHFVPPVMSYFLEQPDHRERCHTVRHVLVGGEQLPLELARKIFDRFPQATLHNGYGPTEAAIDVTFHPCRPDDRPPIPIGRPIANLWIEILDPELEPMPLGVPGEVWLGGVGLARGYSNRPDLTADRFRPDPYAGFYGRPGERVYKTGDLARYRTSASIEFLGRLDHQIKIRGVRIEPGEVEAALEAHSAVGRALVLVLPDAKGEKRLVAYLTPAGKGAPARKLRGFTTTAGQPELRRFLEERLPPTLVPSQVVVLDAFPLLASGKVDRRALPAPAPEAPATARGTGARTPTQGRVAATLEQVLKVQGIGLRDNFFDLGGHSVLAVQAVARLRKGLGVEMPLRAVFESPTVAELAERAEALLRARAGLATPPLVRAATTDRSGAPASAPLSYAQQRLWFLARLEPDNPFYNMTSAVRLEGPLDLAALRAALAEIARRHEALRTVFREEDGADGEPVQDVLPWGTPGAAPDFSLADLAGLPHHRVGTEALAEANRWVRRPFDLTRGPLLRALVLRRGPADHAVVLGVHHIASDGWSMGVLIHEVTVLYGAFLRGEPSPLPELPIQYSDFARWQRGWLHGEALDVLLGYWRRQLADALEPLELPADRPRPPVQSHLGDRHLFQIPPELGRGLAALGRAQGTQGGTLFAVLLAGLSALLHRYTGRSPVTVGFPVANRTHLELEPLIGFFVNTLVLRADPAPGLPFGELLAQVGEAAVSAYVHQDLPFEKLVSELEPERSLAHAPLFQVMLVLQNTPEPPLELPRLVPRPFGTEHRASRFDWTLFLAEAEDGSLSGMLEYSVDLFDPPTIARAAGHLTRLLESAVAEPGRRIGELSLLSPGERHQLTREWNAEAPVAEGEPVQRWVSDWAARRPDAVAVEAGDLRLTYAELADRARQLAATLRGLGVREDDRVAIEMERSPELLVGILGVLEAGAAYLPLDPGHPEERRAFQLQDAGARLVLWSEVPPGVETPGYRMEPLVGLFPQPPIYKAPLGASYGSQGFQPLAGVGAAKSLAYLLYTSGSTGRPKGVGMRHGAIANLLAWQIRRSALPPGARTLSFSQPTFDVSFQEIFSTWGAGGTLVLIPEDERRDPAALLRALHREEIARLYLPAVALEGLAEAVRDGGPLPEALREVITAGERLRITPAVAEMFRRLPECRLWNQYGPTETHVVTEHGLGGSPESWESLPPIGRPVPGVAIHLLGPNHSEPVPAGVAGELCVGETALARGYHGRPDATAERFIPDPFAEEPGARLYRTGDLARRRPDGTIEFLGRADDQVKVRGYRVEPGEVEVALARQPAVAQAVVAVRGGRLVVWIVPEGPEEPSTADLRAALERELPEYMVPSVFAFVAELPLTRTGKVDRRALPDPIPSMAATGEAPALPRTPTEGLVAQIWAEVLGVPAANIGPENSFFALGGHSLLATRAMARVRAALGIDLPLRRVFEHPTVAGFAAALDRERRGDEAPPPPIRRVPREAPLPLSFGQRRLWFLDRFEPGSAVYNMPTVVRLEGELDVPALAAAFAGVVARHEALRTVFDVDASGEPFQVVQDAGAFSLPVVDLTVLGNSAAEARRLANEEAGRPFDLQRGPLFRACLLKAAAGSHLAVLNMHHIVSDGWSLGVLIRDAAELYAAALEGRASRLPELPVQYPDYAAWQREWLSGETLERQLDFWRRRLAGAPAELALPADHPRPPVQTFRGARRTLRVGGARLAELAREETATPFMLALAGFAALLGRLARQDDVVIGTPIGNRGRVELEGLVGFFVNTLVLRVDLGGDPTFRELVGRVRHAALDAYAHQDLPFERLVEELSPDRDLSRSPLFQALLILQNTPEPDLQLPAGLRVGLEGTEEAVAKFDVTLTLQELGDGSLAASLNYNRDLFEEATAQRWLEAWGSGLVTAAADPGLRLGNLPWLSEPERRQVLGDWGSGPPPSGRRVLERFAERARTRPDAEAVLWRSGGVRHSLTYGELDRWSDRIAAALRREGVGVEDRVGVCLDRGPEVIATFLGIWKAGGAYVPLDPAYPAERLRWLADDAGLRLVIGLSDRLDGVTFLDPQALRKSALPAPFEPAEVPLDALACVHYTSGSTGRPKGVAVVHRGLARLVDGGFADHGPAETLLQTSPLSFDVASFEIWGTLGHGGRLVAPPPGPFTLAELGRALREFEVTTLWLTSGLFHLMVDERLEDLGGLRQLLAGGDVVSPVHAARVLEAWPHLTLIDGYGPTENTTFTTAHRMRSPHYVPPVILRSAQDDRGGAGGRGQAVRALATVPIGRPLAGTRVAVLDADLSLLPLGVVGELCTGGEGLARCYLGRPELTAERFVPDPLGGFGERLYRTGDLARWRSGGTLEYLGRVDRQVKVRGFRVEPGEIEAALARHPGIRDAAVVLQGEAVEERRLVAFVVPAVPDVPRAVLGQWRQYLADRLPEPLVPSAFVVLPELPLNANGKVDRAALAKIQPRAARREGPPQGFTEEVLATIWAEVLDVDGGRVGRDETFFELGGHSLLATQVMSRVRQAFGVELPLRDLFEAPTVRGFARRIDRERAGGSGAVRVPPLQPVPRDGRPLPLSYAQQRLWLVDRWQPGSPAYNIPMALRIEGPLLPDVLERTLAEVVRRHEALRTVFAEADGEPAQVVQDAGDWKLPLVDLAGLPGPAREREAWRLAGEEARRPFDLARGPVFRAALLRLAAADSGLLLNVHHIAADGWSLGILMREIGTLYPAFEAGEPSPLPDLPLQYADFALWQRGWLTGEVLEAQVEYWRARLAGAPRVLELPSDRPRPAVRGGLGAARGITLPAVLGRDLRHLARREHSTPFMALLPVFQLFLGRAARSSGVTVGTPIAGRDRLETEGLIGFFVNTLVLRADLGAAASFRELLRQARETALDAHRHADAPFEKLVESLETDRDPSVTPLFQALFALQAAPADGPLLPGLEVQSLATGSGTAKFDLTLTLVDGPGGEDGFAGTLGYATDIFDAVTVDRLLGWFSNLLAGAVADLDGPLHELPMMSAEEAAQLFAGGTRSASRPADRHEQDRASRTFEPPRGPLEQDLAEIWEQVLGTGPVSRDASFFELGGQSLLGVRLLSRVQRRFGRNLPLAALASAPTVEAMAALLRDEMEEDGDLPAGGALVSLQPEGAEPPFFCVHPVGGSVLGYRELARALGADRPFYGIQATAAEPGEGIGEKAARYLEEVRRVRPEGPYFLGGWSLGALIAFEMARQLDQEGQEVALLALLDPPLPGDLNGREPSDDELREAFTRDLMGLGQGEDADPEFWRPHFEVFRANALAVRGYRPEPFAGRAHLFLAREVDPAEWADLFLGGMEVHPVPGGHYGLLREPFVEEWAQRLRAGMPGGAPNPSSPPSTNPAPDGEKSPRYG